MLMIGIKNTPIHQYFLLRNITLTLNKTQNIITIITLLRLILKQIL